MHLNGLNLYAYCINNPVMYYDPTGELFWKIPLLFIPWIVGGAAVAGGAIILLEMQFQIVSSAVDALMGLFTSLFSLGGGGGGTMPDNSISIPRPDFCITAWLGLGVGASVLGEGLSFFKEHGNNKTPSNRKRHEEGIRRRKKDSGGEKGDRNRWDYRKNCPKMKSFTPPDIWNLIFGRF